MFYKICHKCYQRLLKCRPISNQFFSRQISVVFYGSDEFSLETVKLLHQNFSLEKSDNKLIKRLDLVLSSKNNIISRFAAKNSLTTYYFPYEIPDNLYDIGIVSSFGHLIPKRAISACRLGMLNIHGSLLPRWRGAAPVNYAVLNDDKITGVTVMKIKPKKFDVGDIVMQIQHKIQHRITAKQLKAELAPIGAQLLWKCVLDLDNCLSNSRPQPTDGITYAPKFDESYGLIDWSSMTATDIDCRFRAFVGFIDIYTHWTDGTVLRLFDIIDPQIVATLQLNRLSGYSEPKPGFVFYHKKRRIVCISCAGNSWSAFGSLTLKGHKQMSGHQFNNGFISRNKGILILGNLSDPMKKKAKVDLPSASNTECVHFLHVHAKPKSHQDKIDGWTLEGDKYMLEVRITAPPEDGKANKAIIKLLANVLDTAKTNIELVSGHTSRNKVFKIEPWSNELAQRLPQQTPE